jgi:Rhomboid family
MSEGHDPPERRRFCTSCRTEVDLDASNCPTCWRPLPIGSGYVDAPFDDSSSAPLATVAPSPPVAIDRSLASRSPVTTPPRQRTSAREASPPPSPSRSIPALARARTALAIVVGSLALLWIIQIVNNADHYRLSSDYGIKPRMVGELPYVFTAPFLHLSWAHIEGNSLPFLVLGFLVAYRSAPKFLWVTAVVILTSGLAVWLTSASSSDTVGASGVIFGWFGCAGSSTATRSTLS